MKVYFVRHGQTNYNVLGLCNEDSSQRGILTELGKHQAEAVAEKVKDIKLDAVFISEVPRTEKTILIVVRNQKRGYNIGDKTHYQYNLKLCLKIPRFY